MSDWAARSPLCVKWEACHLRPPRSRRVYFEQARTFEGAAQASGEGGLADAEWVDHDEVIIHEVLVAAAEAGA